MPWVNSVPAIVHAWYLGNAFGDAIADVLFGKKNPSGKLSLTFPKTEEDVSSHGHFHSEYVTSLFIVTIPNWDAELVLPSISDKICRGFIRGKSKLYDKP
jgi:Glycosyl hydrolase family 3 C-terminal domain